MDQPIRRGRGRPPGKTFDREVRVLLAQDAYAAVEAEAARSRTTVSDVMRTALAEYLERRRA